MLSEVRRFVPTHWLAKREGAGREAMERIRMGRIGMGREEGEGGSTAHHGCRP